MNLVVLCYVYVLILIALTCAFFSEGFKVIGMQLAIWIWNDELLTWWFIWMSLLLVVVQMCLVVSSLLKTEGAFLFEFL